jgi:glycine/D-amino acid oxidase-like deaminating enzyme
LALSLGFVPAARAQGNLLKLAKPLTPVAAQPGRVIRTVVGLRPFRPSGYLIRKDKLGTKTLVHNYGHGGCGVTLSWGCAAQAVDLVKDVQPSNAAVIGCGVVGLSTARVLQDRGWNVQIYAEHLPPDTTSNIAGALWSPTILFHDDEITADFKKSMQKATRDSFKSLQLMVGNTYGIKWIDVYTLRNSAEKETDKIDHAKELGYDDLYVDVQEIDPASTPFAFDQVRRFSTMLIEPNTYLPALMRDFLLRGGKIAVRKFESQNEWKKLPEKFVFNCTGLGAGALTGDDQITPIRGQLTFLEPQADVNYCAFSGSLYMFPRADGILLGGTYERTTSLDPDKDKEAEIIKGHAALFKV